MWKLPLSDLLFAEPCLICRKPIGEADPFPGLCRHCLSQLPWRASDSRLAWPPEVLDNLRSPKTGFLPAATEDAFQESRIIIACDYESPIREGLLALKFSDATEWHRLFAALLVQSVRRQPIHYSAVIAVPLHPRRLAERGYNQAGLIAAAVARQLNLPDWSGLLCRSRPTERQSEQTVRAARFVNLAGAFAWNGPDDLRAAHVLLIDDVLTTGATLGAAAAPLFHDGARVTGLVVASNHRAPG
jgi:ComF family protein